MNSRRDRRLTFDSDSGSPPWHRLWEKTWHHYCVTYAAVPKEKGRPRNVTFYVDGVAEDTWKATVNTSLGSPLYIGADVQGSKTLDGAVDEVYVYEDALDAWQVGVLYGIISPPPSAVPTALPTSVPTGPPTPLPSPAPTPLPSPAPSPLPTPAPTISPAPTTHEYEYDLVAYYPMTHGKLDDALRWGYPGKAKTKRGDPSHTAETAELRQTEARDGPTGDAVALNNSKYIELPKNVTSRRRRPAADHLPLGADRQVGERRPDLRVRQKGAPGRAVRPAHLGHPGLVRDPRAAPDGGVHQRHGQPHGHRPPCRAAAER